MMKKFISISIILVQVLIFSACSDDNFQASILDVKEEEMTEVDQWIMDSVTLPHNIEILYKWNDFESNPSYNLVPPDESRIIPFLKIIKKIWMEPYINLGGLSFFNNTAPKQIMLVGSPGYSIDGTYLVGEAEGGHKITIYNLNGSDFTNSNLITTYAYTFHHEFSHILHQTIEYPEAFELICAGDYTSSWASQSRNDAFSKGFITQYAAADPNEDFAEMIAYFIIQTEEGWYTFMNASGTTAESREKLKKKEKIILEYMKNSWNIDLYEMRETVAKARNALILEN